MPPVTTSVTDLTQQISSVQSINIERLRANIDYSKRKITSLQRTLSSLKSSEMLILQRMNRTMKMEQVQKNLSSDKFISLNPIPAIKPTDITSGDPDPRVNFSSRHLNEGMEAYQAEAGRINNEVLRVSQEIQKQQATLTNDQASLDKISAGSPELDNIAKRQYSELFMLFETSTKYRDLSTDKATGNRVYGSDAKIISQYNLLKLAFKAYAGRNSFVLSGDLKLDFGDPGSDNNILVLQSFLERARKVLGFNQEKGTPASNQFSQEVEKYSKMMMSNISDEFSSKNVSRQLESKRIPESSLAEITNSINNINKYAGKAYDILTLASFTIAAKKRFHNVLVGLYDGKPLCSDPDPVTPEDTQKEKDKETQAAADQVASSRYVDQFSKAREEKNPEDVTKYIISNLSQIGLLVAVTTGKDIPASLSVLISVYPESRLYTATNLYQYRVLNTSRGLLDFMLLESVNGNLLTKDYTTYLNEIITYLTQAQISYTVQI